MVELFLTLLLLGTPPGVAVTRPVTAIEIATDLPRKQVNELRPLLAIEIGRPLIEEDIRRTLTNLQVTGLAGEIEILSRLEGEGEGAGLVVTVVLRSRPQVEEVILAGELGLHRREVEAVVSKGVGQPLSETQVIRGVYALQDFYHDRGYLEAIVRVRVNYLDPEEHRASVVYQIESGPRASVGEVSFAGELGPHPPADLGAALGLAPGATYRPRVEAEAGERLRGWLINRGYRTAQVTPPTRAYDSATHRMSLTYSLAVGPKVELTVVGASEKDLRKKGLLPFLGPEGHDEALLLEAVDRIQRYYQEKGHYHVEVRSREQLEGDLLRLVLEIVPGPVYTLEEVRYEGNERVGDATLAQLCSTAPRRLLTLGSGRLVDPVLRADLDNIRAYYALQGFASARVLPPRIEEEGTTLRVTIPIEEGGRRRVAELTFEGVKAFSPAELARGLEQRGLLVAGGAYHPVLVDDSIQHLIARYEAAGHGRARISAETRWNDAGDRAAVLFRVLEGPRITIDRVVVRGNRKTDTGVVLRTVDLSSGEPASGGRLLSAQRRLYRLGAFSRVEVRFAPTDPGADTRDVLVRIEEGRTRRLLYGFGYDTEDGFRGLLGFSDLNVAGRGLTFGGDLRLSERDRRARLSLGQPYLGPLDLPLTYTLFWADEARDTFDVERWGGRVEAIREFSLSEGGQEHRAGLIFDYRIVDTVTRLNVANGGTGIAREDRNIRISSLIPNILFDYRDDALDPTRGWTSYAQIQYAFPFLNTSEEFLKLFYQQTHYLPLGRFGVVAGSLRFGAIEPFTTASGETLLSPELPNSRVSIAERFFTGGANSHRAYERDRLAIPGKTSLGGDPVGGNGLLLLNLDYRFPILGDFGGVVFLDAGNVWADWHDIDPGEIKLGVGLGLRYRSPLGPLRLEVGFKLDPAEGENTAPRIFLSVGNPF